MTVVAVLAVGAGIFAAVTYWQRTHQSASCSVYGNALTAALADPGAGRPDTQVLNLLTAHDRKQVLTVNREYTKAVAEDQSLIDSYTHNYDQWATGFKAEALAARGC